MCFHPTLPLNYKILPTKNSVFPAAMYVPSTIYYVLPPVDCIYVGANSAKRSLAVFCSGSGATARTESRSNVRAVADSRIGCW